MNPKGTERKRKEPSGTAFPSPAPLSASTSRSGQGRPRACAPRVPGRRELFAPARGGRRCGAEGRARSLTGIPVPVPVPQGGNAEHPLGPRRLSCCIWACQVVLCLLGQRGPATHMSGLGRGQVSPHKIS